MKFKSAVFLILVFSLALSCSEPSRYVHKSIALMDKNGLFAEGYEWDKVRKEALSQRPTTIGEAQDVVRKALTVAGGKHSFILPAANVSALSKKDWQMPTVEILDDDIAFIKVPDFSGGEDDGKRYAQTVIEGVPEDIEGAIIDLRGNTGGNMYPMIASVHRFIKDWDNMLRFKSRKRTNLISLSFILRSEGIEPGEHIDCPVAILTDSLTASSGEATLICFLGQENVKTFGAPTAGYASSNRSFKMSDGSILVLTTACDVARTGEEFCDSPIAPDIPSSHPLEEAVSWIQSFIVP